MLVSDMFSFRRFGASLISARGMLALLGAFLGWAPGGAQPLLVGVSVAPQGFLVERLGGDAVKVVTMIPPGAGVDVESYTPTPRQMIDLAAVEVYFKVGHPAFVLEQRYLKPFLEQNPKVQVIDMSVDAATLVAKNAEGLVLWGAHGDPHLWTSPPLMRLMAGKLAEVLRQRLPQRRAAIDDNLRRLQQEIDLLDQELRRILGNAEGKSFLIYHPALGLLASAYGLEQVAIEDEGKEPDPARLARLIDKCRQEKIKAILVQRGLPSRASEMLARATGAAQIEIDPLAYDWLSNTRALGQAIARGLERG
jgi:zinc transport system substrate-binding protein